MKKIYFVIISLLLTTCIFAQSENEFDIKINKDEAQSGISTRKQRGFYNIMQVSMLFGNSQTTERIDYYTPYYSDFSMAVTPDIRYSRPYTHTTLSKAPSFTITNGYLFNEHWAAGAGIGFEIFDHNLFPLFAEIRYCLWDLKISPVAVVKGGYSFSGFKARQYDELYLSWTPYNIGDATLRHYGGLMIQPEIGVKIPLIKSDDVLFTAAYRFQKTKSVARKDYDQGQFEEWEHIEKMNRLVFGVAIMFR